MLPPLFSLMTSLWHSVRSSSSPSGPWAQAAAIYAKDEQEATAVAAVTKRTFRVVDSLPSVAPICDMAGALRPAESEGSMCDTQAFP